MKNIIVVIIAVIGIAIIAGLIYFGWGFIRDFFSAGEEQPAAAPEAALGPNPFFQNQALQYWFEGKTPYYLDAEGKIIRQNGSDEKEVGTVNAAPILSALPSPDGRSVIVSFGNPQNPQFSVFSASTTSWRSLAPETKAVAWSTDGAAIASIEDINGVISIFTSNADGTKRVKIMDINVIDAGLEWISGNTMLLTEKSSALLNNSLWLVDVKNKTVQLAARALGLTFKTFQNRGLMFSASGQTKTLELKSADGSQRITALPFVTLPEKCTIYSLAVYCAVPSNLFGHEILPDDYLKGKFYSEDDIYKYDPENGLLETIYVSSPNSAPIDAVNLKINGKKLFFLNRYDGYVYAVDLH